MEKFNSLRNSLAMRVMRYVSAAVFLTMTTTSLHAAYDVSLNRLLLDYAVRTYGSQPERLSVVLVGIKELLESVEINDSSDRQDKSSVAAGSLPADIHELTEILDEHFPEYGDTLAVGLRDVVKTAEAIETKSSTEKQLEPVRTRGAVPDSRILFGLKTNLAYVAKLQNTNKKGVKKTICSGVLIHPQLVLTAAHCFCINPIPRHISFEHGQSAKIDKKKKGRPHPIRISAKCGPKELNLKEKGAVDLAVFRLSKEILAPNYPTYGGGEALSTSFVTGYGLTDPQPGLGYIGYQHTVGLITRTGRCKSATKGCPAPQEIRSGLVGSAIFEGLADTPEAGICDGDSGGPMFAQDPTNVATPTVVAIARGGERSETTGKSCGLGTVVTLLEGGAKRWIDRRVHDLLQ